MKTLITGMTGFVGQNLSKYLIDRQIEVNGISLRNESWKNALGNNVDAIIHLAGKAHDTENTSEEDIYFKVNRDLTIELFNEFLKSEIKDFFFFSSVKAVADTVEVVLKEDIKGNPQTPYGKSKFEAEQHLQNQKLPEGKRLFIIRPCMIHGPGNKGNLNLLYKIVEKGIPWPLAGFKNERSFLSIDNLCYLMHHMLEKKTVASGIYHFADDENISTNKLIQIISRVLGKKSKLWNIPSGFIKGIVKIGDILPLPLNSERLKKLTESYVVSNQKIKNALEIKQLPLSAEEGLVSTITSFKNNKK
ncbi:NAD-dependent epimerase/dehydratase family protein [Chryseobacterium populi]|uniref:Nucleoside-diphosphate-sugar epimerase n=1 Tax=Chryseobacterium populi TaxID=1144316 RepID=J2K407_9FLAO|nr:NAD-dependent epimerase/dehydratase family protein [Chryseobacterium populi]EJL74910.1 nucleoside-diphosphate-sugar epimerase [Chryseobacterium populi]